MRLDSRVQEPLIIGGDAAIGLMIARARDIDHAGADAITLLERYRRVRSLSLALTEPLSEADASAQSMPDVSPAKWHLAHATWFFEAFVLAECVPGYRVFDTRFELLFNSYYESRGRRIPRETRGLITRPSLQTVFDYRRYIDEAVIAVLPYASPRTLELIELGCHHEEQHQELLLTVIQHLLAQNPLSPALWPATPQEPSTSAPPMRWVEGRCGAVSIGHVDGAFAFDCERPEHTVWLSPHVLASRLVTNAEWLAFIDAGGYANPRHWLSDGWDWVRQNAIDAPLYWRRGVDGAWSLRFGLDGLTTLDSDAPVQHVSFYEADAFARWAEARLPTEAEWESAARQFDSRHGNLLDRPGPVKPAPAQSGPGLRQMFGDLWEWTGSAFLAYPGYRSAPGATGEYNGKFMSGKFVLRGGSCATPRGHVRSSYRNFFHPHQRWQFTGVRLAMDA
jgi:ergothioneine biosynthesis protein EgtB